MTQTYWYLASSYSKHPEGIDAAFQMAVRAGRPRCIDCAAPLHRPENAALNDDNGVL